MRKLISLLKKNFIFVFFSFILLSLSNIAQFVWTAYIGKIADSIVSREAIALRRLGVMAVILLSSIILLYISNIFSRFTAEKMAHTLRMQFAKGIIENTRNCDNSGGFEALSKAQNELTQASDYMSSTLTDIVQMSLSGVLVLFFLLYENPLLTILILVPMIVTVIAAKLLSKNIVPLVNASMDKKIVHNKTAYMAINNYDVVKVFDSKDFFTERYKLELNDWAESETKKERVNAICNSLSGILSHLPRLILFVTGGILIWKKHMTIGTLIIFLNMSKSLLITLMNLPSWIVSFKTFLVHLTRADINYQ